VDHGSGRRGISSRRARTTTARGSDGAQPQPPLDAPAPRRSPLRASPAVRRRDRRTPQLRSPDLGFSQMGEGCPALRGVRPRLSGAPLVALRPPEPMLARPGLLPTGPAWSFELKWDGFRALVSTEDGLRVRSRRGWNMTPCLPELRKLP